MSPSKKHGLKASHRSNRSKAPKREDSQHGKNPAVHQKTTKEPQAGHTATENVPDTHASGENATNSTNASDAADQARYYYVPRPYEESPSDPRNAIPIGTASPIDRWLSEPQSQQPWHALESVFIDDGTGRGANENDSYEGNDENSNKSS
ncbi:hypothetical protein PVAG01_08419 [Phlyctema vagabunda]|uniref:Uncharacterized protein n=1 Tax=Phlyctema vagabunda TaxID=108571 RepID=A0ABR4P9D3_9HELO